MGWSSVIFDQTRGSTDQRDGVEIDLDDRVATPFDHDTRPIRGDVLFRTTGRVRMTCAIEHITLPQRPLDSMSVRPMLYEFITAHADEIITVTRRRLAGRPWPSVSKGDLDQGVPLFLAQLSETPRLEATD